jgi:hypothetical protein
MRILSLLVLGAVLAALWTLPALHAAGAARNAATVTPVALIDLGAIFGDDENEPDENETDGGERSQQPSSSRPAFGSGISLPVVLAIALLGVLAAAFVVNRLRRLWIRVRGLSAQASARAREWSRDSWRTRL